MKKNRSNQGQITNELPCLDLNPGALNSECYVLNHYIIVFHKGEVSEITPTSIKLSVLCDWKVCNLLNIYTCLSFAQSIWGYKKATFYTVYPFSRNP